MQEQLDFTRKFSLNQDRGDEIKAILTSVYNSLQEKGYNPINQIVGYILSEDPTYITNYNNARSLIPQAGPGRAAAGAGEKVSGRLNCRQKELEGIAFQLFFLSVKVSFSLPSAGT